MTQIAAKKFADGQDSAKLLEWQQNISQMVRIPQSDSNRSETVRRWLGFRKGTRMAAKLLADGQDSAK